MEREGGFTLVELLVVIAIIAVLAAILFPVFARAKENARQTTCLSNLSQLAKAIYAYANDYDGTLPWMYEWHRYGKDPQWTEVLLQPYVKDMGVFRCPSDIGDIWQDDDNWDDRDDTPYWEAVGTSYGYPGANYWEEGWNAVAGLDVASIMNGSQMPMVFDHRPWHLNLKRTNLWYTQLGMTMVVFVDGHTEKMEYQAFLHALFD